MVSQVVNDFYPKISLGKDSNIANRQFVREIPTESDWTSVIDPYLVDSDELSGATTEGMLRYPVSLDDVRVVLGYSKSVAALDSKQRVNRITVRTPPASDDKFTLYENSLVPKAASTLVVIEGISTSKRMVISSEGVQCFALESVGCLSVTRRVVCKNRITYNAISRKTRETYIFLRQPESERKYKKCNLKLKPIVLLVLVL